MNKKYLFGNTIWYSSITIFQKFHPVSVAAQCPLKNKLYSLSCLMKNQYVYIYQEQN